MSKRNLSLIIPYAVWVAIMTFCPKTAGWYAFRGLLTALFLLFPLINCRSEIFAKPTWHHFLTGTLVGIAVFAIWIAPEELFFKTQTDVARSPYDPMVCGWALTITKLFASAVIIPIAEELFFRKWLLEFAGFWWMVTLFAIEHFTGWSAGSIARLAIGGVIAGIAYGWLAKCRGIGTAIIAHAITNFVLGIWIITRGEWHFW